MSNFLGIFYEWWMNFEHQILSSFENSSVITLMQISYSEFCYLKENEDHFSTAHLCGILMDHGYEAYGKYFMI